MAAVSVKTIDLTEVRYRVRPSVGDKFNRNYRRARPGESEDVYLVGTIADCACHREAAIHLLQLVKEPESLTPICGTGDVHWAHDNSEGELRDVTCRRCIALIEKASAE